MRQSAFAGPVGGAYSAPPGLLDLGEGKREGEMERAKEGKGTEVDGK